MIITPIKTKLVKPHDNLFAVITQSIPSIPEKSVLVITSKIISFCQGRVVAKTTGDKSEKHQLVKKEADYYLDAVYSKYNMMLTIKNHTLAVNAGIDESNASGGYILWPRDLQLTTNKIWRFLRKHYRVNKIGVIVTDSRTNPLRWGVVGTAIAHCGFKALHDYRGKPDLFNRKLKMSQINVSEAIAVAAVLEMGEAAERTPLCIVGDVAKLQFQIRPPTKQELADLAIEVEDDIFSPLLTAVTWGKGG